MGPTTVPRQAKLLLVNRNVVLFGKQLCSFNYGTYMIPSFRSISCLHFCFLRFLPPEQHVMGDAAARDVCPPLLVARRLHS